MFPFFRTFWLCMSPDLCICSSFESLEVQCIRDNDTEKKPSHSLQSLLYTRETLLWSLLLIIIKFLNCRSFSCKRFLLKVITKSGLYYYSLPVPALFLSLSGLYCRSGGRRGLDSVSVSLSALCTWHITRRGPNLIMTKVINHFLF